MRSKRQNKWQGSFILLIALGSAAIAVFAYYALTQSSYSGKNCQEIYDTWHTTCPNTYFNTDLGLPYPAHAGDTEMQPSKRRTLMSPFLFYHEKNFLLALRAFQDVMPKEEMKKELPEAFFYYALTILEQRDFTTASEDLAYLYGLGPSFGFADETRWYYALCLIAECKTKEAKEVLSILEKEGRTESYRTKATQLLQAL